MRAVSIRLATPEDAEEIAWLHVHASLTAYRPIFGDGYSGEDLGERTDYWRRMLLGDLTLAWTPPEKTYVAITREERIAGFCAVGASRDDDGDGDGEVFLLYIAPEQWRAGIGQQLFEAGVAYLRERGFPSLTLWVLEDNIRARSFYEKNGWRPDGARKPSYRKADLSQMRYRSTD
jgi:ribosomal protein S18 acetylase RimI-like enzyme